MYVWDRGATGGDYLRRDRGWISTARTRAGRTAAAAAGAAETVECAVRQSAGHGAGRFGPPRTSAVRGVAICLPVMSFANLG